MCVCFQLAVNCLLCSTLHVSPTSVPPDHGSHPGHSILQALVDGSDRHHWESALLRRAAGMGLAPHHAQVGGLLLLPLQRGGWVTVARFLLSFLTVLDVDFNRPRHLPFSGSIREPSDSGTSPSFVPYVSYSHLLQKGLIVNMSAMSEAERNTPVFFTGFNSRSEPCRK